MTFLSPPNEVTHVHAEENQTTPRHAVSSKGSEGTESSFCALHKAGSQVHLHRQAEAELC